MEQKELGKNFKVGPVRETTIWRYLLLTLTIWIRSLKFTLQKERSDSHKLSFDYPTPSSSMWHTQIQNENVFYFVFPGSHYVDEVGLRKICLPLLLECNNFLKTTLAGWWYVFNPSTWEGEAGGSLWVLGQAVLQSKFQDRLQSYIYCSSSQVTQFPFRVNFGCEVIWTRLPALFAPVSLRAVRKFGLSPWKEHIAHERRTLYLVY